MNNHERGKKTSNKRFLIYMMTTCALGRNACILGYRTLYYSMNRFIEALTAARLDGTYIRWLNMIAKTTLLILDDFGLQPFACSIYVYITTNLKPTNRCAHKWVSDWDCLRATPFFRGRFVGKCMIYRSSASNTLSEQRV